MRHTSVAAAVVALFAVVAVAPGAARAADDRALPAERLEPALDVEGIGNTPWAGVPEHLRWDAALWLGYENDPVATYDTRGAHAQALVTNRLHADLTASLALFDWVELGADVPLLLLQERDDVRAPAGDVGAGALGTAGLGDVVLAAKVRVLRQRDHLPLDVALWLPVALPTSFGTDFFGGAGASFTPGILASRTFGDDVRASASLGYRVRSTAEEAQGLKLGNELVYKLGLAYAFTLVPERPTELGLSLSGAASAEPLDATHVQPSPVELLVDLQHTIVGPVSVFVGGGGGLSPGVGTPDFRVYGGLRFADRPPADFDGDGLAGDADKCPHEAENKNGFEDDDGCPDADDGDGDGVRDDKDKCVKEAEDKDGHDDDDGCPDPDNDGDAVNDVDDKCPDVAGVAANKGCPDEDADQDGIVDRLDKCPQEPEDKDGFEDDDGCPDVDNDKDGLADAVDKCRDEAGPKANHGCPDQDRDADGVVDRLDNCPDEAGPAENGGCAKKQLVVITEAKLEIKDKVFFDTDKDVIQPKSFALLDNVAAVLQAHPEIAHVRVEGHTDDVGAADHNLDLSDRRAKSVLKYLVGKGVDAARLTAQGFGSTRPIADNATADGKAQNRRVEFVIVAE